VLSVVNTTLVSADLPNGDFSIGLDEIQFVVSLTFSILLFVLTRDRWDHRHTLIIFCSGWSPPESDNKVHWASAAKT
jgi:hypothetical protein